MCKLAMNTNINKALLTDTCDNLLFSCKRGKKVKKRSPKKIVDFLLAYKEL